MKYENSNPYPLWGEIFGWCLALTSMLCVPGIAIFLILREKGTIRERIQILLTPKVKKERNPNLKPNFYFSFLPMFTDKRKENTILKLNLINNNKLYHCVFINLLPRIGMLHCNLGSWWFASIIFSLKLNSSTILTYLSSPAKFCKQFEQGSNVTVNQDSLIAPQVDMVPQVDKIRIHH